MGAFDDRSTRRGRARGARRGGARDRLYRQTGKSPERSHRQKTLGGRCGRSDISRGPTTAADDWRCGARMEREEKRSRGLAGRVWSVCPSAGVARVLRIFEFASSARARDARWTIDQTQERCSRSQPYARARSASKAARLESTLRNAPIELSPPTIDGEGATGAPSPPNKVAARSSVYSSEMTPFSDT